MKEQLSQELLQETEATLRLLGAVPESKLSWKPHQKSMSIGQLSWHIATIPQALVAAIAGEQLDVATIPAEFPAVQSSKELLELASKGTEAAVAELQSWDLAKLQGMWSIFRGDTKLAEMPRAAAVRTLAMNHLYHHRGQLSVYLRLLDVDVPSTYGPTADDNPFAG